jgi:hypothetical protein
MKARSTVVLLVLAVLLTVMLVSCELAPVSIAQRIQNFQASLNGDRTKAYKNLHPDSSAYTVVGATTDLWDLKFPTADIPYTISNLPADPNADPANVTAIITGSAFNVPAKFVVQLYMTNDWRIWDIQLDEGSGYRSIL